MTPECCKTCGSFRRDGSCQANFRKCERWRAWFHKEWEAIQKAAGVEKKNKKEEPPE